MRHGNGHRLRRCVALLVVQSMAIGLLVSLVFLRLSMRRITPEFSFSSETDDEGEVLIDRIVDSAPPVYRITDPPDNVLRRYYAKFGSDVHCLVLGTLSLNMSRCVCIDGWSGDQCSIPKEISTESFIGLEAPKRRERSRRFFFFIATSSESDDQDQLLVRVERLMYDLKDMVEVFIFTNDSRRDINTGIKEFTERVKKQFGGRLLIVWDVDTSFAKTIYKAFKRLSGIRLDDLVVFVDANSMMAPINKHVLQFIKLFDGQPVKNSSASSLPISAANLRDIGGIDGCTVDHFMKCCNFHYEILKRNKSASGTPHPK